MDNLNGFKNYMDKIEADTELKENTGKYVREALAERMQHEVRSDQKKTLLRNLLSKKMLIPACSFAAFALMTASGYAYYVTPVNYISLDINPSVELGINAFSKVVSAKGINADGKNLIEGKSLTFMSVKDSVNVIIAEAAEKDYINYDGSTVIAVTTESDDKEDIAILQQDCLKGIDSALGRKNIDAVIYKDSANPEIREEAEELSISPGKLNLIHYLQKLDPSVTVDQYKDSQITEIVNDANDLLTDYDTTNDQLVKNDDTTDEILKAGDQLEDAQDNTPETDPENQSDPFDEDSDTISKTDNHDIDSSGQ